MAEVAVDRQVRSVLIQMAQVWFRLAQTHAEENSNNNTGES